MSRVDERFPELDFALLAWRRRLNRRLGQGRFLVAAAVASITATAVTATLPLSDSSRVLLAVVVTVVVATAGVFVGRRFSRREAALWLDQAEQSRGLFLAATVCLERPTPFDESILGLAQNRVPPWRGRRRARLPWQPLLLRATVLAASLALSAGILVLPRSPERLVSASTGEESSPTGSAAPENLEDNPSAPASPRALARRLFPENPRLAALAEQALASGDPAALDDLLGQLTPAAASQSSPPEGVGGDEPSAGSGAAPGSPETNVGPGGRSTIRGRRALPRPRGKAGRGRLRGRAHREWAEAVPRDRRLRRPVRARRVPRRRAAPTLRPAHRAGREPDTRKGPRSPRLPWGPPLVRSPWSRLTRGDCSNSSFPTRGPGFLSARRWPPSEPPSPPWTVPRFPKTISPLSGTIFWRFIRR